MATAEQAFDPIRFKETQRRQWNEDAEGWYRWGSVLERWHGLTTATMLSTAGLEPDSRVLDIATGNGEPALSAARQLGPNGEVLATDLSENLIQFARQRADELGLGNVKTRVMDGEQLRLPDGEFDVVFCRFGLIYMPNPRQALAEWHRVLKPGGRAVIAVFTTPDRNAWAATPVSIIRRRVNLPPPDPSQPGPFSLGADDVLAGLLQGAGFRSVETQKISTPLRMRSAGEYVRFAREAFGAFNQMMVDLPKPEREAVWDTVIDEMRQFETAQGFEVSCEPLIARGVK